MIVYVYTFPNGKKYVGQTVQTLTERAGTNGVHYKGQFVYNAIKKYGWENIKKEVFQCSSIDEMNKLEKELVAKYNAMDRDFGYNRTEGGDNGLLSEETKELIRQSKLGENNPNYGKHTANSKTTICVETKEEFESIREAAEYYGLSKDSNYIYEIVNTVHSGKGLHFITLDENENKEDKLKWIQEQIDNQQPFRFSEEQKQQMSLTRKGNPKYSHPCSEETKAILRETKLGAKNPNAKIVFCKETGQQFGSYADAADWAGYSRKRGSDIGKVLDNPNKRACGYHWVSQIDEGDINESQI